MLKILRNRKIRRMLTLTFLVLGVYYVSEHYMVRWGKASYAGEQADIDTAMIETLLISSSNGEEMSFQRSERGWIGASEHISSEVMRDSVKDWLMLLWQVPHGQASPEKAKAASQKTTYTLVATDKNAKQYHLEFGESQSMGSSARTEVNCNGYNMSIAGNWQSLLRRPFAHYRNRTLTQLTPSSLQRIEFLSPRDSSVDFQFARNRWQCLNVNLNADTAACARYVGLLTHLTLQEFENGFGEPLNPDEAKCILLLKDAQQTELIRIAGYYQPTRLDKPFVVNSSQNKDAWFRVDSTAYRAIFDYQGLLK